MNEKQNVQVTGSITNVRKKEELSMIKKKFYPAQREKESKGFFVPVKIEGYPETDILVMEGEDVSERIESFKNKLEERKMNVVFFR